MNPGLRVIAGTLKGRRLAAPPGLDTRPLPDRIKQSLFDWLGQDLSGMSVADICAGSGSFGIEAYSRGAVMVHLVESGRHAQDTLTANLRAAGNPPQIRLHARPFQAVLPLLRDLDLVFSDPPFPWFSDQPALLEELAVAVAGSLIRGGEWVLRGEQGQEPPPLPHGLTLTARREFGRSWIVRCTKG